MYQPLSLLAVLVAALMLVACVSASSALAGPGDDDGRYDADAWPGKDAPSHAGVDVGGLAAPAGTELGPIEFGADGALTRTITVGGRPIAYVTVRVADDPAGAHALLLSWLTSMSRLEPVAAAASHGLALGHVAYADAFADGQVGVILFVRGNVAVQLRRVDEEASIDLTSLAEALDVLIAETPVVKDASALPKPVVSTFGLEGTATAGEETTLLFEASAADNGELDIQFEIDPASTGAGYVQERNGEWIFVGERAGTVTLHVYVTSATGLRTTATATITVS